MRHDPEYIIAKGMKYTAICALTIRAIKKWPALLGIYPAKEFKTNIRHLNDTIALFNECARYGDIEDSEFERMVKKAEYAEEEAFGLTANAVNIGAYVSVPRELMDIFKELRELAKSDEMDVGEDIDWLTRMLDDIYY